MNHPKTTHTGTIADSKARDELLLKLVSEPGMYALFRPAAGEVEKLKKVVHPDSLIVIFNIPRPQRPFA
ncbi:hypothetical protein [Cohnella yongneupensis]|uniref:Uncharacterized protein n=1 Tax=Cohnella yongneupensis TaxID=425006 RepID=A0ABW0R4W5_9BACL